MCHRRHVLKLEPEHARSHTFGAKPIVRNEQNQSVVKLSCWFNEVVMSTHLRIQVGRESREDLH
jgi:hypothetical protein